MTHLLVGATLPGLLSALDGALGADTYLTTLREAGAIEQRLEHGPAADVLILDENLVPLADELRIENTLWRLLDTASSTTPPTRALLVLREATIPYHIREHLIAAARATGGDCYVLPKHAGPAEEAAAVRWLTGQLPITRSRSQSWLMPLSGSGGVGKSTALANLALAMGRRGYRVLIIDADFANGSLTSFFKVPPGSAESLLTLPSECPHPNGVYPQEAVQRRIVPHLSKIDLLLSGRGMETEDLTLSAMRALIATVHRLPYDVVCLDAGPDIKARPYAMDVLRDGGSALVVCPPGRKERRGADVILNLLSQLQAPGQNASLLGQAAILFVEPEHGSVADVYAVQRDMMRQYRPTTDLGIIPRDARLLSMVAEREGYCTVYDLDPRGRYCRALEVACDRLIAHLRLAPLRGELVDMVSAAPRGGWLRRLRGRRVVTEEAAL